jgi:hypothetical protein
MSVKFNRNDDNAKDDEFYLNPDYRDDLNGVEEDLRDHTGDFHPLPCIISGLNCTTDDDVDVDVSAGVAYDEDGYRIEVPTDQLGIVITLDGNPNWICARHKSEYSRYPSNRRAVLTGAIWNNRKGDGFEIVVRDSESWPQPGDVTLVKATYTGGVIVFDTTDRTSPDFGGQETTVPGKVTGVNVWQGEELRDAVDQINVLAVEDTFPVRAWLRITCNRLTGSVPIAYYEFVVTALDYQGTEYFMLVMTRRVADFDFWTGGQIYCFFPGLRAGAKFRVKVRAVNILGLKGAFSDSVDITMGWGTSGPLTMSSITIATYPQGVKVTWNHVTDAYGYELFLTESLTTPPDPDPNNKAHFRWRGMATEVILSAQPSYNVKVGARCYDKWGRYSSNFVIQSGTGGTPA